MSVITMTTPVHPSKNLITELRSLDSVFNLVHQDDVKAPKEVWEFLLEDLAKAKKYREVNGCGSTTTKYVPDTIWGLEVTALCHIHDAMYALSKSEGDCDLSNNILLINLLNYINRNSNMLMQLLRHRRAITYYSAVHAGKHLFCPGCKND